jgi:hypothetical protein
MMDREYTVGGVPNWDLIPNYMREGLQMYIERGIPPGDFLTAVLCNDFMNAVGRADGNNREILHLYAQFLHNYAPIDCYGSPDKYVTWCKQGGLDGRRV